MGDCPNCGEEVDHWEEPNVTFIDMGRANLSGRAPKRVHLVACGNCETALGASVSASKEIGPG